MNNSSLEQTSAPTFDELEISLFGPGVGECVVVHLGNNNWAVVDSCKDQDGYPVALSYLRSIGLNPKDCVRYIIVSHWHDDHIKGIAELVRECSSAKIVLSNALLKKEFLTLVDAINEPGSTTYSIGTGLGELNNVIQHLHARGNPKGHLIFAQANKRICIIDDAELWSLSPSDTDILNSLSEFGSLTSLLTSEYRGVVPSPSSNLNAVALLIVFGERNALLGADLENSSTRDGGWSAIVDSVGRPKTKAKIFKVPHHGSENAHNNEVINELLEEGPVSLLTTFNKGTALPKEADVDRIKAFSNSAYITTLPKERLPKRNATVEKQIKAVVSSRRAIGREIGHVRVRTHKSGVIDVQTFGPAIKL